MTTAEEWRPWAPPLDPPDELGLPLEAAEQIAAENDGANPHLIAALLWEAWAATLQPGVGRTSVTTGVQSVTFAGSDDPFALAMVRADWHRGFLGDLYSVPLGRAAPRPLDRHGEDVWP